jgi:hypothetical protein
VTFGRRYRRSASLVFTRDFALPAAHESARIPIHAFGEITQPCMHATVMLPKVIKKDTGTVISALIKNARQLRQELCKSLTWDWRLTFPLARKPS